MAADCPNVGRVIQEWLITGPRLETDFVPRAVNDPGSRLGDRLGLTDEVWRPVADPALISNIAVAFVSVILDNVYLVVKGIGLAWTHQRLDDPLLVTVVFLISFDIRVVVYDAVLLGAAVEASLRAEHSHPLRLMSFSADNDGTRNTGDWHLVEVSGTVLHNTNWLATVWRPRVNGAVGDEVGFVEMDS